MSPTMLSRRVGAAAGAPSAMLAKGIVARISPCRARFPATSSATVPRWTQTVTRLLSATSAVTPVPRTRSSCPWRVYPVARTPTSLQAGAMPITLLQPLMYSRGFSSQVEVQEIQPGPPPRPHAMSVRFARTQKPFWPMYIGNLRPISRKKRRKKRGAGFSGKGGLMLRHMRGSRPHSRTWEGGTAPLFQRVPRWPQAHMRNKVPKFDPLNLSKLRYFIEKGRLDTRFPITQRHLHDSSTVSNVTKGVSLFNVNDFPFPYKIDIEVMAADQSSVDVIRAVGGSVTIVYMEKVALRAHIKPYKYQVLPRTPRPTLKIVHYLEKMKARGALVRYIKPLWLIEEERRLQTQLRELDGEEANETVQMMARVNER